MRIRGIAIAAAAAVVMTAPAARAAERYEHYVALGDSYAAVGNLLSTHGTAGCFRSTENYAADLAKSLHIKDFTDISCGSATTEHLVKPQNTGLGTNPPQLDGLSADTDLVTLTIGGNDLGFVDIATGCGLLSATNPFGNPCQRANTAHGVDKVIAKIDDEVVPKVAAAVRAIAQRAPRATVVVAGYLPLLPPQAGCWPVVPLAAGDATWLHGVQRHLDDAITAQAGLAGGIAVNPSGRTGHDACQVPSKRWVEPVLPAAATTPLHPNAAGQRALAGFVEAAITG
ncbi:SGNH/GDSL hydrolase family protein [Amycolatopsis minnesotensis]|uniref:SGNH/GDSL hydrolase family protein n=1 Tax=Amycolatopsis minnesotensis TaxID=337894 RepID=A0ABN2SPD3_9PSEU